MSFDDELLLTTLGGALETHPAQPSAAELATFRSVVAGDELTGALAFPEPAPEPVARRRGSIVLVAAALVVSLVVVGAGVVAAGTPLPNSLRSSVRALGIPVDDTAVAQTRTAMADVRRALEGTDDLRLEVATRALRAKLQTLSASDLAEVAAPARVLLELAGARLDARGLGRVLPDATVTAPVPEAAPSSTTPAVGDDGVPARSEDGTDGSGGSTTEVEPPEVQQPAGSHESGGSSDGSSSDGTESETTHH